MTTAATLRKLATSFEKHGHDADGSCRSMFTCCAVLGAAGWQTRAAYCEVFELGYAKYGNTDELWAMGEEDTRDMRVLMLCFAAAMAETGDL